MNINYKSNNYLYFCNNYKLNYWPTLHYKNKIIINDDDDKEIKNYFLSLFLIILQIVLSKYK